MRKKRKMERKEAEVRKRVLVNGSSILKVTFLEPSVKEKHFNIQLKNTEGF